MSEPSETREKNEVADRPDSWWMKVYIVVLAFTVLVISGLGLFSWYFG